MSSKTYAILVGIGAALAPFAAFSLADSATQPAGPPTSTTAPADPALSPEVVAILDRLERKGTQIDSIESRIDYTKIDPVLEDRQDYQGLLRFKKLEPNPRFFIEFDTFKHEGVVKKTKQWHVFDGQWYIEARETTGTITKTEIVRPGETLEVFKVGKGPFPLPFGQKKADIERHFTVKLVPPAPGDPTNSDHLECTPRPDTEMARKYDTVHFYIDRKLDLPVRVETMEKQEGNRIIASFTEVKVNPGLVASQLNLPELKDYKIQTEPLRGPSSTPADRDTR